MITYNLNVEESTAQEMIESFCKVYNFDSKDGITPEQFTRNQIINFIKNTIKRARVITAEETINYSVGEIS